MILKNSLLESVKILYKIKKLGPSYRSVLLNFRFRPLLTVFYSYSTRITAIILAYITKLIYYDLLTVYKIWGNLL